MSSADKNVLTEEETAQYVGLSRATLRRGRMEGSRDKRCSTPPFLKLGRSVRYRKCDLDHWLQAHLVVQGGANGK